MKSTKFISTLLLPALLVACNDDVFDGGSIGNMNTDAELHDVTLYVGLGSDATTKGDFASDAEKGVFGQFYFEPDFDRDDSQTLVLTNNSAIKGDVVGLCLPNPLNNGNVMTNVPFYIAGYQAVPGDDGTAKAPFSLAPSNDFYKIADQQQTNGAFEESAINTTMTNFDNEVDELEGGNYAPEKADIRKAIFKSVSGVMTGDYVLYYPYNKDFTDMTKIPAVELPTIMHQTTVATQTTASKTHVLGENLFAYSKQPFSVNGEENAAMNMTMTPAAYFFQFKIYTTASSPMNTSGTGIKLITVSTADGAAAFAKTGHVSAGTTNTFAADAETAVDMIGVDFAATTSIPSATSETKNANALTIYLSTYPVKSALSGKDIVINLYTENGKVYTVTKAGAGSKIVEGGTDYWNIDMNGLEAKDAERLVYNETTLESELNGAAGTLVLKNDIVWESTITIDKQFTIKGGNYSLTIPSGQALKVNADCDFQCAINNKGTLSLGTPTKAAPRTVSVETLNNEGNVTVPQDATLKVTTLNNLAVAATAATVTVQAAGNAQTDIDGVLQAATLNNAAAVNAGKPTEKKAGVVTITGSAVNTTIENAGTLTLDAANVASTLTVNNEGTVNIGKADATTVFGATLVNEGETKIVSTATVNAQGAKITNNGSLENNGTFTLLGNTTFANNGEISDLGVFSGLSRLTNSADATLIRAVNGYTNLVPALAEEKVTGIRINEGTYTGADGKAIVITTDKDFYLAADLELDIAKASTIGTVTFEGAYTLTGYITTNAITVENGAAKIGENSNITVNGNITVANSASLEGADNSYTICNDIVTVGTGSVSGNILVK